MAERCRGNRRLEVRGGGRAGGRGGEVGGEGGVCRRETCDSNAPVTQLLLCFDI